jgi:L,D-transpeptidase YcbB
MNIYLHDTPNHRLFSKSYRALSHGCVRLDDPDKLAELLLKNQRGWDMEAIEKAMHSQQTQSAILKKSYPVHLEYRTAWVDENGLVNFREDIYGHDRRQLAQLKVKEDQPMVSAN